MAKHAFLSASASHRWINCPPSAKLCEGIKDESSPYAQEGTDCHELCAYLVEKALGRDVEDPTENLTYYNGEMQNCAEEYTNYVLEQYEKAKAYCSDPMVFIEQRLDFSRWVENGFGTGDCVIIADEVLHIIDYKHGLGVLVESEGNTQMMCYALGALEAFDDLYDVSRIEMTIFQPRRDNVSTSSITKEDLLTWAEEVLKPTAVLAYEGKGEFKAGDHCQFCKVKATCRKRAETNLELAKYDFEMPATLDDSRCIPAPALMGSSSPGAAACYSSLSHPEGSSPTSNHVSVRTSSVVSLLPTRVSAPLRNGNVSKATVQSLSRMWFRLYPETYSCL